MSRPKHQDKDLEELICDLEAAQWRVVKNVYFKCFCPCGQHKKWIHCTPDQNYAKRTRHWFATKTCWDGR